VTKETANRIWCLEKEVVSLLKLVRERSGWSYEDRKLGDERDRDRLGRVRLELESYL
jgi:hypothetical protein